MVANQGDEAAIRMGLPSGLSFFTAGDYPGPGDEAMAHLAGVLEQLGLSMPN